MTYLIAFGICFLLELLLRAGSTLLRDIGEFLIPRRASRVACAGIEDFPLAGKDSNFITVANDGLVISGRMVRPCGPVTKGVVILCHSWGLSGSQHRSHACWLAEQGYVAVLFDFRNCGSSGRTGRWIPSPLDDGVRDLDAVLTFVRECVPEFYQGVSVFGCSYGAYVALVHAARIFPTYRLLVFDSGPIPSKGPPPRARGRRPQDEVPNAWFTKLARYFLRADRFRSAVDAASSRLGETPVLSVFRGKEENFLLGEACRMLSDRGAGEVTMLFTQREWSSVGQLPDRSGYWAAFRGCLDDAHGCRVDRIDPKPHDFSSNRRRAWRYSTDKNYPRIQRNPPVQILDVVVDEPDASGRDEMADGFR